MGEWAGGLPARLQSPGDQAGSVLVKLEFGLRRIKIKAKVSQLPLLHVTLSLAPWECGAGVDGVLPHTVAS